MLPPSSRALRMRMRGGSGRRAKRLRSSGQSLAFRVDIANAAPADAEEYVEYIRGRGDPIGAEGHPAEVGPRMRDISC